MAIRNIKRNAKTRSLENTILISILLFLYNIVFPIHDGFIVSLINELLVLFTLLFLNNYLQHLMVTKTEFPLSMILNTGILGALIFFVISISNSFLNSINGSTEIDLFSLLISILIPFLFLGIVVFILTTFRQLFLIRQKKDPHIYFNTMLLFFVLTFLSNLLLEISPGFNYPYKAFFVVSIILISLNALRVAWIAFLVKKQKLYLLLISVILSILFGFNFGLFTETSAIRQIIYSFSPGLGILYRLVMIYGVIYFGIIFFTTLFHLPTAEAFDRKAEEVSSLMDLTKLITQVFDFKELADTVTSITTKVCNSYSAWLVTKNEDNYELEAVNNISFVEAEKLTKLLLNKEESLLQKIQTVYYDSVSIDIRLEMKKFKSIVIAPLKVHDLINGFLFTARKHDINFDEDEKRSLQAFADYAAVALENAKLIAESIEKERIEKELDVARDIQRKILPNRVPVSDKFEINALFVPAFEVGGDYYDFFELEDNKLGFVVADVSGKGISSAFIMAEVKGIFESLSKLVSNPRDLLIHANGIIKKSLDKKSFVTAIYGILNKETGLLRITRAGHPPAIFINNKQIERLLPSGIGLGLDFSHGFANTLKEMQIELQNGDIVAFYSDGIPEAKNSEDKDYGYSRLEQIIIQNRNKNVDIISNEIIKDLSLFSKDRYQHDDITLVLLKWKSKA